VIESFLQFLATIHAERGPGFHLAKSAGGTKPSATRAWAASSSICSQISSLRCSVQMVAWRPRITLNHGLSVGWGFIAGHFAARGLQDLTFARGQALDAVGGDFFQDRIDFLADEFGGRQFFRLAAALFAVRLDVARVDSNLGCRRGKKGPRS